MASGSKILLADDNPADYHLAIRRLAEEYPDLSLEQAGDAQTLARALEEGGFDLVITGHQSPWPDGLAVLEAVKRRRPDCPVIMFTGAGDEELAVEALKRGLDDYVVKSPRNQGRLAGAIRAALARKAGRRRGWGQAEVTGLLEGARTVLEAKTFSEAARRLFETCQSLIGSTSGYVALLDPEGVQRETVYLGRTSQSCRVTGAAGMPVRGLKEKALRSGRPVFDNDFPANPWHGRVPQGHLDIENVMFAPLAIGGKPVGLIGLANKPGGFSEEDGRTAAAFGELAAVALRTHLTLEALEKSRNHYLKLFEEFPALIWRSDRQGGLDYVNRAYLTYTGRSLEEELGQGWISAVHPEDRADCHKTFTEAFQVRRSFQREYRLLRHDGRYGWIVDFGRPFYDLEDEFAGYIGSGYDITERKQAERDKARLEVQLRQGQKMEALGALAGGIAHDFNNILAAILGYSELTLADLAPDSHTARNIRQVIKASQRAKELVQHILSFSRQGSQELKPISLSQLVKEVLRLLRSTLPTTIEIRHQMDPGDGTVLADPSEMHQVLMNLATNAAHAMRGKGVLEVSVGRAELAAEPAAGRLGLKSGPYAVLSVQDTGHGMDQATLERIFEPYFTTKKSEEGTGLGLSVVHGIVKRHGGAITVDSQPGQGATFKIYLPRIDPGRAAEAVVMSPLPRGSERILLVDDEASLVDLTRQNLERLGYRVVSHVDSLRALEEFRAGPDRFDLVITDQTMPRMTGGELAQAVLRIRPEMPVILCTGFSENVTPESTRTLGVKCLLMKPLSTREVAETVRRVLEDRMG